MSSLWDQLLAPTRDHNVRRMAWRVMRQFAAPSLIAEEFNLTPNWLWLVAKQSTAEAAEAIKLLLTNEDDVRCETVVLFPPGPKAKEAQPVPSSLLATGNTETLGEFRYETEVRPVARTLRATACISSQPGCGVGCPFCSTGTLGYRGNLTAEQIVEQVYWAGVIARQLGRRLRNVVYMGMGEPLHNSAAVFASLDWLIAERGFGMSPRHLTVSTAGVPSAMLELARRYPRVSIALSLHSADPAQRRSLVPRATGDLSELHQVVAEVNRLQTQAVWIEVVLFDQFNDTVEHARSLIEFCRGLQVEVNLIPYNAASNSTLFTASPRTQRELFASLLRDAGIRTTIRSSLGATVSAACGQLTAT